MSRATLPRRRRRGCMKRRRVAHESIGGNTTRIASTRRRDAIRATTGASPHRASRPRSLGRLAKSRRLRPARVLAAASPWPR
jgi:hypothetical protein